ncbi:MAG: A24 family peptidase [Clostridiales Family XIII bacterium]|jgi:leader peptidase (prepilin peptidase)/N-methyltransferase|nr:A24 family peptidase [Clostridiales Family XIII bacterium]
MTTLLSILFYIFLFSFGATIGSYINVIAYRTPLFLRRRCRYCGTKIPLRHLIVKTVSGGIAILCWTIEPSPKAILFFATACVLLTITLIDVDTQKIPDSCNLALFILGVTALWVWPEVSLLSRGIGFFVVSVPLFMIALIIAGAFGMGDVKLMAAAGFLIGWQNAILALSIGLIFGGSYGTYLLATKKKGRKEHFAFGPCLAIGIFLSMLWGKQLIHLYLFGL